MKTMSTNLGISDLIQRIKEDLLSEQGEEKTKLFSLDEITLELNFLVSGDIASGFNLGIVTLGSDVSEERVQKIKIKMSPLVSKTQLLEKINNNEIATAEIIDASEDALIKGPLRF